MYAITKVSSSNQVVVPADFRNIMPYQQVMKSHRQKLKIKRIQMIRNDVYLTITIKSNSLYI